MGSAETLSNLEKLRASLKIGEKLHEVLDEYATDLSATKEALLRYIVKEYKVESPLDLVIVEQHSFGGIRFWVEPMSPSIVDTRVAVLNQENDLLRKKVKELEGKLAAVEADAFDCWDGVRDRSWE